MAVFVGDLKNSNSAKTALQINKAVIDIINPALSAQYPNATYRLQHVIGIDTSPLFVARIGVRNDNDLVWVGRAANHAAKLSSINEHNTTFITEAVFNKLADFAKFRSSDNKPMWTARSWTQMGGIRIYCSNWRWEL